MEASNLSIFVFILVGFIAQLIDGALGMAYGVSSNSFLLGIGVPPASASASVHMAEVVTTAISGFSHWRLGNLDRTLVKSLLFPGALGAIVGAYILTNAPGDLLKPFIAVYLLIMGVIILVKGLNRDRKEQKVVSHISTLGVVGGFFDAIGGGGWGPIVTSTLVARGNNPRLTIGSVNFSEFFITFSQSVVFVFTLQFGLYWKVILGLLIGGAVAAPMAALVTKRLPVRQLMLLVGALIILLSIRTLYLALAGR
jgi:uncharacterized membrane protein YfcA